MKKYTFLVISIMLLSATHLVAQSYSDLDWNTNVKKQMVIISSSKSYESAKNLAQDAAEKMNREFRQVISLKPNKEIGLTMSKNDCEESGWEFPCYAARGHGSAENTYFISVEHSGSYDGLTDGYYIVVACIDETNSPLLKASLAQAKQHFKDAYIRNVKVWFGCMH